jgi:hypothetical protein
VNVINSLSTAVGRRLAHYLNRPRRRYESFAICDQEQLASVLQPADVLLVDGVSRVSTAIRYLTQSTWTHAAMYVGDFGNTGLPSAQAPVLIEADLENGVVAVSLDKYDGFNTRICRPVGLDDEDCGKICQYMIERIGLAYDLKNIIDLARYLLPEPPVPARWRRRMLALGSGDPTRAICSSLIAQAFQSVRYPILPHVEQRELTDGQPGYILREILHIRHHSLFTPRDFDVSPYFRVIKPTLEKGFNHRILTWSDQVVASVSEGQEPRGHIS